MPHGFFTIEQWVRPSHTAPPQWVAVGHLNANRTLSDAISHLEKSGNAGFYRFTQTQRMIWAETENGKLRLRRWHARPVVSYVKQYAGRAPWVGSQ